RAVSILHASGQCPLSPARSVLPLVRHRATASSRILPLLGRAWIHAPTRRLQTTRFPFPDAGQSGNPRSKCSRTGRCAFPQSAHLLVPETAAPHTFAPTPSSPAKQSSIAYQDPLVLHVHQTQSSVLVPRCLAFRRPGLPETATSA